jgi:hypothetical protein
MCDKSAFRSVEKEKKTLNTYVCPKCGYPQYCGCTACIEGVPVGIKPYKWNDQDCVICSNCGFTAHIDWWLDETVRQYKQRLLSEGKEVPEWLSTVD